MTKILNLSLKLKGVVGRVAHAKSSDPATPPKKNGTFTRSESQDLKKVEVLP